MPFCFQVFRVELGGGAAVRPYDIWAIGTIVTRHGHDTDLDWPPGNRLSHSPDSKTFRARSGSDQVQSKG